MRRTLFALLIAPTLSLTACNLESQARVDSIHRMNEGVKHYKKNNLSGAEQALKEAIKIDPTNHKAHEALGTLMRKQERWADAEAAYKSAIESMAEDQVGKYHYELGLVTSKLAHGEGVTRATFEQKANEAIASFDQALKLDPTLYKAHYQMGRLYEELDQPEQADQAYRASIDINGGYTPPLVSLGSMYIDYGFSNVAMAVLEAGTKANPTDAGVWKGLGEALQNLNKTQEAIDAYTKATKIDPDQADVYFSLGMAYAELRQKAEATEALETFLKKAGSSAPPHTIKAANDTIARMSDVI